MIELITNLLTWASKTITSIIRFTGDHLGWTAAIVAIILISILINKKVRNS